MDLEEVVTAAKGGDEEAWAQLVAWFQDRALAAALGWSGNWDSAADLAQDAFRLAYLHLEDLREPAAFPAWFGRVVRTACSRASRTRAVRTVPLEDTVDFPQVASPHGPRTTRDKGCWRSRSRRRSATLLRLCRLTRELS